MDQLTLHKKIDDCLVRGPANVSWKEVSSLIRQNADAKRYFYSKANEAWFDFLRRNGAFELLKQKAEDPTRYSYQTSELNYVVTAVEKVPSKVADLVLTIPISKDTFNPEVIDRFLWATSKLPAADLKRVVIKIRDEQWPRLMGPFNRWGFEYKEMLETLAAEKDYGSIVVLAEAILLVRSKDEIKKNPYGVGTDNPFYFNDLHQTEVFTRLDEVPDEHLEEASRVATVALGNVVRTIEKENEVFEFGEMFHLFDVDFFELRLGDGDHRSYRDDVQDLAAVVKGCIDRAIGKRSNEPEFVRSYYDSYIKPLPDSRTMWRLRLYVWSQCPEVFKQELRDAFFRGISSKEMLFPLTGGAEYEQALLRAFKLLDEHDRSEYIRQAIELLGGEKNDSFGYGIFSSVYSFLTDEQREKLQPLYKIPLDPNYKPVPTISHAGGGFGTVVPQAPDDSEEIWKGPVAQIIEALKTRWSPAELRKLNKSEDFHRPVNAEGVADRMRGQMKERMREYTREAPLFFQRDALDAHYTYSFFRGIQEAIRENHARAAEVDWQRIFELGQSIATEGVREPFDFSKRERESFDTWLSSWIGVHEGLADVLQEYLKNENGTTEESFKANRDVVFRIIRYLLTVPDPEPRDEQPDTAGMKSSRAGSEMLVSDPFSIAINSARGRAYQAFVLFMEWDSRPYPKDAAVRLSEDVLKEYTELLGRENTGAIMFMYGHYLPFFYYRAVEPIRKLFPKIFPTDPAKYELYLAAWEGYLTRSLFKELFVELQGEYERAIRNDPASYPVRNYYAELDDALATHIALAYIHFKDFTLESNLFKLFWSIENKKRHKEFAAFIGRHIISRENPQGFLKEHPEIDFGKLLQFWDWLLENVSDPDVFAEMGFWMNVNEGLYRDISALARRIRATLVKSRGRVDWEIRLMEALPLLAEKAPEDTVEILRLYFTPLDMSPQHRHFMRVDAELVEVFRKLYQNPETKDNTYKLIDDLLPLGNGAYWKLKEALS